MKKFHAGLLGGLVCVAVLYAAAWFVNNRLPVGTAAWLSYPPEMMTSVYVFLFGLLVGMFASHGSAKKKK